MRGCSTCMSLRSFAWRTLLLLGLLGVSLYLAAAERMPAPAAAAASALKSVFGEAAKPATQAASAMQDAAQKAIKATPKPADVAASATKVLLEPLMPLRPASTASGAAPSASNTPSPVPAPASASADVTSSAACMRTSDAVAACQPGLQLSLSPIALPTARMGAAYKTRKLVSGGVAPYRFEVVEGSKPEGLDLAADGTLGGKAIGPVRQYSFTVQVNDASVPPLSVRQAYTLRVEPPAAPRPAAPASTVAPVAPVAPAASALPVPRLPQIASYMLLQEDLDDMFPKPPADPASAASGPAPAASEPRRRLRPKLNPPPAPYAEKMQAMLAPMLNIDYPAAELFASALESRRCIYYAAQLSEATQTAVAANELQCPTADGSTPPPHPGNAALPPTLFADLLPPPVKRDLIARAEWPHYFSEAQPIHWTDNGCGCVPPLTQELVYGLYPFWQAREKEQQIQFNLYNRIGYLGAQVTDTGEIVTAVPLSPSTAGFAGVARRFGTQVDLVIHRSEWTRFLNLPDGDVIVDRAVRDALALADAPYADFATRLKRAAMPFWDEPAHLFDGVTLYFDNAPTDVAGKEKFRAFYRSFVHKLIAAMQKTRRPYMLSIVVPDSQIGDDGSAYSFDQLMGYLRLAQRPDNPRLPEGAESSDYIGTTDITIGLLVLMREPTGAAKKALRARIDNTELIQGHRRVAFLNAVAPVLFHSGGEPKAPIESVDKTRLDLDLAYIKWQYGGVSFWPMPQADTVNGQAVDQGLATNYGYVSPARGLSSMCDLVCPHRSMVRLVFMAFLLSGALALSLYVWVCAVRRLGRPYIAALWACGLLTLAVGLALLTCDPQLVHLRRGNALLFALLAVAVLLGMYHSLRPRVTPP